MEKTDHLQLLNDCKIGFPILSPRMSTVFRGPVVFFLLLNALLLIAVLVANGGVLSFVLDDPLIHLRLAENIWLGHYGINLAEASAPSSSILWPYLLSPFAGGAFAPWVLLLLNIILAIGVIYFLVAIIAACFEVALSTRFLIALICVLVFLANLPALVFVGMEHVLQLLLSVMIVQALVSYLAGGSIKWWLWLSLFLSPLVRYENSVLVAAVLLFLFFQRFYWQSILLGLVITLSLAFFSWYLHGLHLGWMPTSILLKSSADLSLEARIFEKLAALVVTPKAWFFLVEIALFSRVAWSSLRPLLERQLAACSALFIILFLALGSFGWYFRYEAFAWLVCALLLLVFYRGRLSLWLCESIKPRKLKCSYLAALLLLSVEHIFAALLVPIAANNIYLQQYQMGRFVRDYYQAPVAVNDIGWVSYLGGQYTLDLWGLASVDALKHRLFQKAVQKPSYQKEGLSQLADVDWMQTLAKQHNVGMAMIYFNDKGDANGWFERVPESWQRLGSLTMQAAGVSVSMREVVFFATGLEHSSKASSAVLEFSKTLPPLTQFEFYTP